MTTLNLKPEEAFFTYHTVCAYLTGDYLPPRMAEVTDEHTREVAMKIDTGASGVQLTPRQAHALSHAYSKAHNSTPLDYSYETIKEIAERIYSATAEVSVQDGDAALYYGSAWDEKRKQVLKRDNYECQNCGVDEDTHKKRRGFSLHVHHIVPLREFDDVTEANRLENLVSVCASCHNEVEGEDLA
jgi:5-methylcytosine-specific restriction endonuclease McrA